MKYLEKLFSIFEVGCTLSFKTEDLICYRRTPSNGSLQKTEILLPDNLRYFANILQRLIEIDGNLILSFLQSKKSKFAELIAKYMKYLPTVDIIWYIIRYEEGNRLKAANPKDQKMWYLETKLLNMIFEYLEKNPTEYLPNTSELIISFANFPADHLIHKHFVNTWKDFIPTLFEWMSNQRTSADSTEILHALLVSSQKAEISLLEDYKRMATGDQIKNLLNTKSASIAYNILCLIHWITAHTSSSFFYTMYAEDLIRIFFTNQLWNIYHSRLVFSFGEIFRNSKYTEVCNFLMKKCDLMKKIEKFTLESLNEKENRPLRGHLKNLSALIPYEYKTEEWKTFRKENFKEPAMDPCYKVTAKLRQKYRENRVRSDE
eukprot:TRINITY_DN64_c5_g1_i2.p1 TRINITY_DN64_c5_g1~~TRINITY_DN64_c5_g1_i2.p1  ORF type:complete len:375 (-),score=34.32 TRINITY_DN64_c5_g1_i2:284-1408(-)